MLQKLNDFKHFSAEETPTNLAATSGGGGFYGTVESRDGGVGPAIKSVTSPRQSPKEKSSQQYQSAANSQSRIEESIIFSFLFPEAIEIYGESISKEKYFLRAAYTHMCFGDVCMHICTYVLFFLEKE